MLSVTLQAVRYWKIINFMLERSKCRVITDNERESTGRKESLFQESYGRSEIYFS